MLTASTALVFPFPLSIFASTRKIGCKRGKGTRAALYAAWRGVALLSAGAAGLTLLTQNSTTS